MKFVAWSDLHAEHNGFIHGLDNETGDVLILAGDILSVAHLTAPCRFDFGRVTCAFAQHLVSTVFPRYRRVIFVFGNHEPYDHLITRAHHDARLWFEEQGATNLEILEDGWAAVDDVIVYGCTLWSDLSNDYARYVVEDYMPDYKRIRLFAADAVPDMPVEERLTHNAFGIITGTYTHQLHLNSVAKLEVFLAMRRATPSLATKKLVVVSHHAPSLRSNAPAHSHRPMAAAYASPLDRLITAHPEIAVWVHGHTHSSCDYLISRTRVFSNQLGYVVDGEAAGFRSNAAFTL